MAPSAGQGIDPWEWDTDRVVRELCTGRRSWKPLENPPILPDPTRLENELRDNLINGISLLKDADDECFFKDLGVKANKHKSTLRDAISQFRRRSCKYKTYLLEQEQADGEGQGQGQDMDISDKDDELEDMETRKRKLQAERMSQTLEDHAKSHVEPVRGSALATKESPAASPIVLDHDGHKENGLPKSILANDASSRKKRRIEPLRVSSQTLGLAGQAIPTQADTVIKQLMRKGTLQKNPFLEAPVLDTALANAPKSGQGTSDESWYLGEYSLTRVDVVDFDSSPLTDADATFAFRKQVPIGRRRQVNQLYKRHVQRQIHRRDQRQRRRQGLSPLLDPKASRRPAKADTVFGADDPDHGEVLPLLGESDSDEEYDSDTWAEIEAEQREREAMAEMSTALSSNDVNMVLDQGINEYIANWTERKLPKLERRANTEWNIARRHGLKWALDMAQQNVNYLQKRLVKFRAEVNNQNWRNKADVKSSLGNFEPTVLDLQAAQWKLKVIKSPSEPKRVSNVTRRPAKKCEQRPRPTVNGDEGDLLISDSEDDFTVKDNESGHGPLPQEVPSADEMLVDSEDGGVRNDLGVQGSKLGDARSVTSGNAGSSTPTGNNELEVEDNVMADVAGDGHVDEPSCSTPSIFDVLGKHTGTRNDHDLDEVTDLTQVGLSSVPLRPAEPKPPETPTPRRSSYPPGYVDLTTPEKPSPGTKHQSQSSKPVSKLNMSLARKSVIKQSPGFSPTPRNMNRQLVKNELVDLPHDYREPIFSMSKLYKEEPKSGIDLWTDYILPHLGHPWTGPPFQKKGDKKINDESDHFYVSCFMARLFDLHTDGRAPKLRAYWKVNENMKKHLANKKPQFKEFMPVFCKLVEELRRSAGSNTPSSTPVDCPISTKAKGEAPGPKQVEQPELISEDSDDETEEEHVVPPSKKRRPIQRDRAAQNLRDSDKARVKEQAERRMLLRAKLATQGHSEASQNSHLLINESKEDDQGFIYVPDNIASRIKPHQVEGVRFMWNQLVADFQSRQGCLLAHTMGLGKTMQIITLLVTIADAAASDDRSISNQIPDELKKSRTLILAPAGLVNNWTDELLLWIPDGHPILGDESENLYKIDADTSHQDRHDQITDWAKNGGILVIGYNIFKSCAQLETLADHLFDEANIVVADEAHMLKSEDSQLHHQAVRFKTRTRIALTGSPLANNVKEYRTILTWVCPGYLSSKKEFDHDYRKPIEEGLSVDSSHAQKRKALTKLRALKETVAPKVHRRTIAVLHDDIPPKMEFVISVPLTELQRALYEAYVRFNQSRPVDKGSIKLLVSTSPLNVLCNHPDAFRALLKEQKNKGSAKDGEDSERIHLPAVLVSQLLQMMPSADLKEASYSSKMLLLDRILDECKAIGDKVLVFSQSMKTIHYLENKFNSKRRHYKKLDGTTHPSKRPGIVRDFNSPELKYEVFLISTTAGGLGLNITGANRVVIMDSKWNPQQEQQAVGRAFRIGQIKPVFVYRLICGGTLEVKLHHRQVFKMQLAQRVVDDQKPIPKAQRLAELFNMPSDPEPGEVMEHLGKDTILDGVLKSELGSLVKSIVITDTFEEEAQEEEVLAHEEEVEAQRLISNFHARQGQPLSTGNNVAEPLATVIAPPQHMHMFATPGTPQTGVFRVTPSQALPGGIQSTAPALTTSSPSFTGNRTSQLPAPSQSMYQPASPSLLTPAVQQMPGGGSVAPVPGATTQLRQAGAYWDNIQAFKSELVRVFSAQGPGADVERRRAVAHEIAAAFEQQQHRRQLQGVREAKWAAMDSSHEPRFVEAVMAGLLTPIRLAQMEASEIVNKRDTWKSLPQASWEQELSAHRHNNVSTVGDPRSTFMFASSTAK
ncbi:hypothetical protein PG988_009488 [Apiospora saccharicola]